MAYEPIVEVDRLTATQRMVKRLIADDNEYVTNLKQQNSKLSDRELVMKFYNEELYWEERESMLLGEITEDWMYECFANYLVKKVTPERIIAFNVSEFTLFLEDVSYYRKPEEIM